MYRIDKHIKMPTVRRRNGSETAQEAKWIAEFITAYRRKHNCTLVLTYFDSESRIATLKGPTFTLVHSARRCKELLKTLKD